MNSPDFKFTESQMQFYSEFPEELMKLLEFLEKKLTKYEKAPPGSLSRREYTEDTQLLSSLGIKISKETNG